MQGLELSRCFYFEAVRPILRRGFPRLDHTAALIGWSSEVLGFDDERSQDHEWGPRLQLFLRDIDAAPEIARHLAEELPLSFAGFPTSFGETDEPGTVMMAAVESGPVSHRVETLVLHDYLLERLGVDPLEGFGTVDWLATPAQRLLELTAGEVFVDEIGDLTAVRSRLAWYPHSVWLLVLAGLWRRVAQLEPFVGRTGSRGDELGSRLVTASIARDLMRLALVQERVYPPYAKWLGTAYSRLARREEAVLTKALGADEWRAREEALVRACSLVLERQNELQVCEAVDPAPRLFWGRPFRILGGDRVVEPLLAAISDPEVRAVGHLAGSVDAVSDNADFLTRPGLWRQLAGLWDAGMETGASSADRRSADRPR